MATPRTAGFRYIGTKRRAKEHPRFVAGRGRFVADLALDGMKHVALVTSPHPAARIVSIRTEEARAMPGVRYVLTGEELVAEVDPVMSGVDAPQVKRYPLAHQVVRYAGEWVAAVVADTRALAEDAAERVVVKYEPTEYVLDAEAAFAFGSPLVHVAHGSNVLYHRQFVWGPVDEQFASADQHLDVTVRWARSATVPIETFGVMARWDSSAELLDVWASIQMPKFPDQTARALRLPGNAVRVHYDVDVGGSYGVKRGLKHTILVGYLARRLGVPVRFIEDRLENMRGGDMHGPDRKFDVSVAFRRDGTVLALRIRAIDDVGAYAGRAPLQLGKPVGAIVGPYRIPAVAYEPISVMTNKTPQEAVRGFGQSPTNYALETTMDRVAEALGMNRIALREKNLIRHDEFPYTIPSGTSYDSGDYHTVLQKALAAADYAGLTAWRDRVRKSGGLAGIGISTCLEPNGGNSAFEPLFNPKNETTTWMDSCLVRVDLSGAITGVMASSSSGQAHETLVATCVGEILERDPGRIRVVRADSLNALPSNSPVGSRMAIMLGGAAAGAAKQIRATLMRIAAHQLRVPEGEVEYSEGNVFVRGNETRQMTWEQLVEIAHRKFHLLPPGVEPGLQAKFVWEVPQGGALPTPDGRVQMYPCFSFEAHVVAVQIDPLTAQPRLLKYVCGHDCGVMINPEVVHGMTYGGIAHGIGAALYEKFAFTDNGQLANQTFMDYLMPSALEVPHLAIVDHCTPSPLTEFGQKGSGEAGYLGAPAAIASAINDALSTVGVKIDELPMTPNAIWHCIRKSRLASALEPQSSILNPAV
ncbi:MAG TPA: xanthine dehydrogenase family protein molybdopterin-binding subunit, partial [Burkholderiales bacterium]|nr:xanthine dehydrogenase family protein molybdopterin-binding subunit [Burkholderiales bacterium]